MPLSYGNTKSPKKGRLPWALGGLIALGIVLDAMGNSTFALLVLGLAVFVFIIAILTAWNSPTAFLGFWIWVHLEDLVRMSVQSFLVFFIKDLLYGAMLVSYWLHRPPERSRNPITLPLFLWALMLLLQSFNPRIEQPLLPLVGFHAKLFYIPLMFLSRAYFDSYPKLRQFLIFFVLALGMESGVAILQYFRDPQWWYSLLDIDPKEEVVGFRSFGLGEGLLKTGSVFNNPGRFSSYVTVATAIVLGSFDLFHEKRRLLFLWIIGMGATFIGGVLLQSGRTTFYVFLALCFAVFLLYGRSLKTKFKILFFALPLILLFSNWIIMKSDPNIKKMYVESITGVRGGADTATDRVRRGHIQIQASLTAAGLVGHGTGTSSQGRHRFSVRDAYGKYGTAVGKENGYAALIWEFGPLGPLVWIFLMGTLLNRSWKVYRSVRDTRYSRLAFSIVALILSMFVILYTSIQSVENYLVAMHFWTFVGILFALPKLLSKEGPREEPHGPQGQF